jgi:hypothetical protein
MECPATDLKYFHYFRGGLVNHYESIVYLECCVKLDTCVNVICVPAALAKVITMAEGSICCDIAQN